MRTLALAGLACLSALTLTACTSAGYETSTSARRESPMEKLRRDCEARGGILVPTGRFTGEPALDNLCSLHGASIPPP
jgi:hypothetical protein